MGGKTKMLSIQMKVLEPKWKQEQRRSLQNTANKYAKRSSRTFICCLSIELKSRSRISPVSKNRRIQIIDNSKVVVQGHIALFSSAGIVRFTHTKKCKVHFMNHLSRWLQTPTTKLSGEMVIAKHNPKPKSENHSSR